MLKKGFYICHSFDVGTRLDSFEKYEKRESLTYIPNALRYQRLKHESLFLWVNELGLLVAFQPIPEADNLSKAQLEYRNNFDRYYKSVKQEIAVVIDNSIEGDSSFLVYVGSQEMAIDWQTVHIPYDDLSIRILLEAVFIDQLCRTIDKRSRSFVGKSSLAEEKLVVEYVENLFPLAMPESFLVAGIEVKQMKKYYLVWGLNERVAVIRGRFAESVTNTALYRGHLDRHRQSAMNFLLSAIAVLSLAQVSEAISDTLCTLSLCITKDGLNKTFALIAVVLLVWGIQRHVLWPTFSLWKDDKNRKSISYRILKKGEE